MTAVSVQAYARTHTATFVADKMRNLLKVLIRHHGLDPQKLVDAWSSWVDAAARAWMEDGDLRAVIIEFYRPDDTHASARWDFPIRYDGTDIDQMWVDRDFFQDSFAKAAPPPGNCTYRVLLLPSATARSLPGICNVSFLSLNGMVAREAGTVIATADIMASMTYYR
jgi:hypothetical protein